MSKRRVNLTLEEKKKVCRLYVKGVPLLKICQKMHLGRIQHVIAILQKMDGESIEV